MHKLLFLIINICLFAYANADIESGVYITPNVGYAIKSNKTGTKPTDNYNYSLGVFAGYAFNEYWAVDANVTYLPNTSDNQFNNYFMSGFAARGSVWLSSFFSAYIRLGGGLLSNASDNLNSNGGVLVGVGGLFELDNHMAITLDNYGILLPFASRDNFTIISAGFSYGF